MQLVGLGRIWKISRRENSRYDESLVVNWNLRTTLEWTTSPQHFFFRWDQMSVFRGFGERMMMMKILLRAGQGRPGKGMMFAKIGILVAMICVSFGRVERDREVVMVIAITCRLSTNQYKINCSHACNSLILQVLTLPN